MATGWIMPLAQRLIFGQIFAELCARVNPMPGPLEKWLSRPTRSVISMAGLNGALDFMLLEGLRQTFAFGSWSAAPFSAFPGPARSLFPARTFSRPSFLDNHDMNRYLVGGAEAI